MEETIRQQVASRLRSLSEFPEREPEWLIPGWIPANAVTVIAGAGGTGKSALVLNVVASLTSGERCVLTEDSHEIGPEQSILLLNAEDDIEYVLHRRAREAGCDLSRILIPHVGDYQNGQIYTDCELLHSLVEAQRPVAVVIDPLQAWLKPGVNLNSLTDVRASLQPLIGLCEKFHTAVILVCHTNKSAHMTGADRVAGSVDVVNCARSVILLTEENFGQRKASHVKSNFGPRQQSVTIAFDDEGRLVRAQQQTVLRPREAASEEILRILRERGEMDSNDFREMISRRDHSSVERARRELIEHGVVTKSRQEDNSYRYVLADNDVDHQ